MRYGYFDDERREYVITTPNTPQPWINYLGNRAFFSLISNTAGGYSFHTDAKLRRITRYRYNNVPVDMGSRFFYIRDGKDVWSPTYKPSEIELDGYSCRHGMGYTIISGEKNDVEANISFFVPIDADCEIQHVVLRNHSDEVKELSFYGAVEWCLWNAVDDTTNYQRNLSIGEVEVEEGTIYHKTEYRERRNHYAFYHTTAKTSGFDTDRDSFLGKGVSWDKAEAIHGDGCKNSVASGWYPIAAHEIPVSLEPGQSLEFSFILGYAENPKDDKWEKDQVIKKTGAKDLILRFSKQEAIDEAFLDLKNYWTDLLSNIQVNTKEAKLDRMVNVWNQYQCMVTFFMSRSASYYETGTGRGMGFRDSCQDLFGVLHMIPERARERIIDIASIQFEDGSTYHQYQPLTKRGNADIGGGFNDDPLWLVACTTAYIKETGDYTILDEPVPFDNVEGSEVPLLEHLKRSVHYTMNNQGPHGLPLIGRADWNDCLNLNCFSDEPGESFQTAANFESGKAESVFIAAMFVKYGKAYAELCRRLDLNDEAELIEKEVLRTHEAIETVGWDGEWFIRAFDAFENPVGSHVCEEGQIYIEPQGFAVMAGVGIDNGYAKKALDSVEERLANPYGIQLLNPCYTKYHLELGEISSYPPGYKENGGIFCHNNPWITIAHTRIGQGNEAFESYRKIAPAFIEDISEIHQTEPYVYSQMIAGREAKNYGQAKNSWLTGTAAWTFVSIAEAILGIRADYDGLLVNPCLPDFLEELTVIRRFRGKTYKIHIKNEQQGKTSLSVNDEALSSPYIPLDLTREDTVEVVAIV